MQLLVVVIHDYDYQGKVHAMCISRQANNALQKEKQKSNNISRLLTITSFAELTQLFFQREKHQTDVKHVQSLN